MSSEQSGRNTQSDAVKVGPTATATYTATCVLLGVLTFLTVLHMLPIGFADHDSMYTAIRFWTEDGYYDWVSELARKQGRWQVYVSSTLQAVPFLVGEFSYYKIVSLGSVFAAAAVFIVSSSYLLRSRQLAVAMGTVFLTCLTLTTDHSLLTGYFVTYHLFIVFYMSSLVAFDRYLVGGASAYLILSATLYLACCLIREFAIVYLVAFPVLVWAHRRPSSITRLFTDTLRLASPHLGIAVAYVASYFLYRNAYPSTYAGNVVDPTQFSLADATTTLFRLSLSAFPLATLFDDEYRQFFRFYIESPSDFVANGGGLPIQIRAIWVLRAMVAGGLASATVLTPVRTRKVPGLLVAIGAGSVAVFLPNVLLAITPGYQASVARGESLTLHMTYFSYLGVVLVLGALLCLSAVGAQRLRRRGRLASAVVASLIVGLISLGTDYSNSVVSRYLAMVHQKWAVMDEFLASDTFASVPEGSSVYAPSLWEPPYWAYYTIRNFSGSHLVPEPGDDETYWSKYARFRTDKEIRFFADRAELLERIAAPDPQTPTYLLRFVQEPAAPEASLQFARIVGASDYGTRLQLDGADSISLPGPIPSAPVDTPVGLRRMATGHLHAPALDGEGLRFREPAYFYVDVPTAGLYEVRVRARAHLRPEAELSIAIDASRPIKWRVALEDGWHTYTSPFAPRLTPGRHLVELRPGPYDFVLADARVTLVPIDSSLSPKLGISRAYVEDGALHVAGWALAAQPITRVTLSADGRELGEIPYGLSRPDVLRGHPEYKNAYAGFAGDLSWSGDPPERIRIQVHGSSGLLAESSRAVTR